MVIFYMQVTCLNGQFLHIGHVSKWSNFTYWSRVQMVKFYTWVMGQMVIFYIKSRVQIAIQYFTLYVVLRSREQMVQMSKFLKVKFVPVNFTHKILKYLKLASYVRCMYNNFLKEEENFIVTDFIFRQVWGIHTGIY